MIELNVTVPHGFCDDDLLSAVTAALPITKEEILDVVILKKSLRTDKRPDFFYDLRVGVTASPEKERGLCKMKKKVAPHTATSFSVPKITFPTRPLVVGSGPAGLFCALTLAEAGACPILLERGYEVEKRAEKVAFFEKTGILDTESNIAFGEGGAGTFSDGKLKIGAKDALKNKVLTSFAEAGAPASILTDAFPHVGTDVLRGVIRNLRLRLCALGATFLFGAKVTNVSQDGTRLAVRYTKDGREETLTSDAVFLATGHSAHDVYAFLDEQKVPMESRPFGVGVRIEHKREKINRLVYGETYPRDLETASYHLVTHLPNGRGVYSFCMCPGGTVVPAASEGGRLVTNGMSEHARMADNSNAALLVGVTPADYADGTPLAGLAFQEKIERSAFSFGGGAFTAPAQRVADFMEKRKTVAFGEVTPSYSRGVTPADLDGVFPTFITDSLRAALPAFDAWLPGFLDGDAVLTGAETRSTSPVRITRDAETLTSPKMPGLYPVGEGAGYSGGIVSSAVDGIRCALAYVASLQK